MTTKELRDLLATYPDDLKVFHSDLRFGGPDSEIDENCFELWSGDGILVDDKPAEKCLLVR
jgi:hypothetical protein